MGDAEAAAARIRASLAEPFPFDGIALRVTASIGIASAPDHAADVDALLRRADVAMYEAKRGRLGHAVYAATIDTHSRDRLSLLGELADGIHSGQLALRYQPMVCMRTGEITGAEALVRWNHPTRGELPPAAFLPWIEQTDLMRELSRFVLQAAVEQAADWRDAQRDWHIAVNVSPGDLLDLNFPNELTVLLAKHRLDPERLTIEVTESALLTDPRRVREVLTRLRARGIAIALDDFGTGYSSLTHLQELPADIVKIDRTFVARMGEHGSSAAIVRSVVQLAQALDMRVTAEGIEDAHRWRALGATGCDTAQGYFLARPLLAAELEAEAPAIAARARAAQAPPAQRPSVGSVVMTRATTASEALARRT